MNTKQTVILWIAGILVSFILFAFGMGIDPRMSAEIISFHLLQTYFVALQPILIFSGLLIYTLRDKGK